MRTQKTILKRRIDPEKSISSQLLQWLLGFLLAILIAGGLWTTVLAGNSLFSTKYKYIPVALRTDKRADYSSNPEYNFFMAISIDIATDILEDEAFADNQVSDEQVSEWKDDFFNKLQAPIPTVKSLPDKLQSEQDNPRVSSEEEIEDKKEEIEEKKEEIEEKIEDKKEEIEEKIEDKKEEIEDKKEEIEDKKEEIEEKIEDKKEEIEEKKEEIEEKKEDKKEEIEEKKKDKKDK